jgi:hypothetical protein
MSFLNKNEDLILHLLKGPPQEWVPVDYILFLQTGKNKEVEYRFHDAVLDHYPDDNKPSHIVVWTINSVHVYDYHSVNCVFRVDENGKMIR